jgi:hypothetical protein
MNNRGIKNSIIGDYPLSGDIHFPLLKIPHDDAPLQSPSEEV